MRTPTSSPSRRPRALRTAAVAAAVALLAAGCTTDITTGYLPSTPDMTDKTADIMALWNGSWIAAMAVGVITWGLMIWCIVVYRKRKDDDQLPVQLRYHVPLELMYTVVPIILIGSLYVFSTQITYDTIDVEQEPDLNIEVYGKQWSWDFNYLDEDVYYSGGRVQLTGEPGVEETLPTLYLPVDQTVRITAVSRDVQHAFWVPAFLFKIDMIPGRENAFQVTPQQEGVYAGKCAELCGEYHSEMLFNVAVVSQEEFDAHMDELRDAGNVGRLGEELNRQYTLRSGSADEGSEG